MSDVVTQDPSLKIGSVPVILIYLNIQTQDYRMIPKWATEVLEFPREEVREGQSSGRMLLQGKRVFINSALVDLVRHGYIPLRCVVVNRSQGVTKRVVIVFIHRDMVREGDNPLTVWQKKELYLLTQGYLWDTRVYRNPGESGGNYIVESGNPKPASKMALADLIIEDDEFGLVSPVSVSVDDERRKVGLSSMGPNVHRTVSGIISKLKEL